MKVEFEGNTLNVNLEKFNSIKQMCDKIENYTEYNNTYGCSKTDDSRVSSNKSWYGVKSRKEAYDFIRTGWGSKSDLDDIKLRLRENLKKTKDVSKRIAFQSGVVGFTPIVPNAVLGLPNSMLDMKMKKIKSKIIKLVFDLGATCGFDKQEKIEAGKNIIILINNLERAGYRVRLIGMCSFNGYNKINFNMINVTLKSENQPFDLKKLMFPLLHIGFFRVIAFNWLETNKDVIDIGVGRGTSLKNIFSYETINNFVKQLNNDSNFYYIDFESALNLEKIQDEFKMN